MFKSILVPIDIEQPNSWDLALPQAIELAEASRGSVTVMTVVKDLKAMFEGRYFSFQVDLMISGARDKLIRIVSGYRSTNVPLTEEVCFGSIGHEILRTAHDCGTDLVVMASHRPEMRDYLIGPNAAHVAQHAKCSVLVLRRPEDKRS
jgi:nucleotide-binding universal stress UspA family protein